MLSESHIGKNNLSLETVALANVVTVRSKRSGLLSRSVVFSYPRTEPTCLIYPTDVITASHQSLSHLFNDALLSHIGTFLVSRNRGSFIAPLTASCIVLALQEPP